jgi:hypothetical protein
MQNYKVYLRKKQQQEKEKNPVKTYFYAEVTGSDYVQSVTDSFTEPNDPRYESFQIAQERQFEIFKIKDSKYGRANIIEEYGDEETKDSLRGIWFRMRDKLNRIKNLIEDPNLDSNSDESIIDTLDDLSNYCNIAIMVKKQTW